MGRAAHPWLTLGAVALGVMMVLLDTSIVSVANPTIGRELRASLGQLQWVTSAFLVALATGLVLGGKLGDLYGRRRLFVGGASAFALASLGCGLAQSIGMLVGFRVAQGLAGAAMMPQTLATLRATFDPRRFQLAVGVYVAVSSLAIASGPIVGGVLVQAIGWRSIFFINLVLGALVVTAALAYIDESRDARTRRPDIPGVALLAAAMFCLVWALVNASTHPWTSSYTLAFLAVAAAAILAWTIRSANVSAPLVPLSLFRSPRFDAGVAVILTVGFSLFGVLFYVMLYLQRVRGLGPIEAGAELLPLTVLSGIAAPIGGVLAHRIPLRAQLSAGLALAGAGAVGLAATLQPHSAGPALWGWFALLGIGIGVCLTGGSQAVVGSAPTSHAGVATGIQQTTLNLGGALATAVSGSLLTARVAATLPRGLASRHVAPQLIEKLVASKTTIAQGILPSLAGLPAKTQAAIAAAAHEAITSGIHTVLIVIAAGAITAGVIALLLVGPSKR